MRHVGLLLGALVAVCWGSVAQAKEVTLQHDTLKDGSQAAAVCGFAVGEKFAVRFTPPSYPAKLTKVSVMLGAVPLSTSTCQSGPEATDISLPMEVFHLSGSQLPGTSLQTFNKIAYSSGSNINELDVSGSNISINDGSFLVVYTISDQRASPVHDNSNAAHNALNFIYGNLGMGAKWYSFADLATYGQAPKGDWVVRVNVDVPGGTGGAGGSSGSGGAAGSAGSGGGGGSAGTGAVGGAAGTGGGGGGSAGTGAVGGAAGTGGGGPAGASGAGAVGGSGGAAGQAGAGAIPGRCAKDTDCKGGERCELSSGICMRVTCETSTDCAGGYVCPDHVCRKLCSSVSDCRGGEVCGDMSGVRVCQPEGDSANSSDDSGCAVASSAHDNSAGWLLGLGLLGALVALRRRRAR